MEETITINGMSCQHCVQTVIDAIKKVSGVKKVKVNLDEKSAWVRFNENKVSLEAIRSAIKESGFEAD